MSNNAVAGFADAEQAIHQTYTAYADAFARDPAATAAFCSVPALIVLPQSVTSLHTRADVEAHFAASLASLRSLGYTHSKLGTHHVKMLNSATALYFVSFVRLKSDETELERSAATYLFHRAADGWKIHGLIATDLDKLL